jgi:hypothetical protein
MAEAPATPAVPTTPAAPTSPSITFGGGSAPATPAAPKTPVDGGAGTGNESGEGGESAARVEAPDKFEFKFDGDDEAYTYEEKTDDTQVAESYDATKPFDPKIEELLKNSPEELKAVKAAHYELRQIKAEMAKAGFKSPKELRAYKSRIDSLGGSDAIEKEAGEWATTWAGFQAGDPAVLEEWGKENPEGMVKLSGPMLDWLHKTNPGAWANHMGKVFMSTLTAPSAGGGLSALASFNALYDIPEVANSPAAQKLLKTIAETINGVHEATKAGEQSTRGDGGGEGKRSQELEARGRVLYLKEVNMQASPIVESAARQAMKVALKGLKVSKEAEADILSDIKRQFNSMQKSDEVFQKNAKDLLGKNDTERFLKVLKSAIARNMPRAAIREARKYKGLSGTPEQRKAEGQSRTETAGGGAAASGRMRYSGPMKHGGPDPGQIDYTAMRNQFGRKGCDDMLSRHEFLKKGTDGKIVYFW